MFVLISTINCQMLRDDIKYNKIQHPPAEPWGAKFAPSWAYSMTYAAEIFHMNNTNERVVFSPFDLFNELKKYMGDTTIDKTGIPHEECLNDFNDSYNPECVAFFVKKSNYTFITYSNNTYVKIVLKDYEVLNLKTYSDLQNTLNSYLVLYNGIYYDKTDSMLGTIYNSHKKNITGFNSTCLVIGTRILDKYTYLRIYSEILHPYSTFTRAVHHPEVYIPLVRTFEEDLNNISVLDYSHLYDVSIGLTFEYVVEETIEANTSGEEINNVEENKVNEGYKTATITLSVISGILITIGGVFGVLCTKCKHLFKPDENVDV